MAKEHVLVVEDEEDILELVKFNLEKNGYKVTAVDSGEKALEKARGKLPDLMLLDLMLPGIDGLEVCKIIKHDPRTLNIPVVMLTAKGEEADIVAGLELGADDYIVKPFSPRVLVARMKAVLRRESSRSEGGQKTVRFKELVIDPSRREVSLKNKLVDLTYTEFQILHFLVSHPGRVYTRYQIIDAVRGTEYAVTDRSVDVQIVGLRKKLGSFGKNIETVRGVGYRFKD